MLNEMYSNENNFSYSNYIKRGKNNVKKSMKKYIKRSKTIRKNPFARNRNKNINNTVKRKNNRKINGGSLRKNKRKTKKYSRKYN